MKYVIVLGDGMADEPIAKLGDKTPIEYAKTPNMDRLSASGEIGMVDTVPEGMNPGSDVANLSVMGYDSKKYYTGRSPLEALSIGIDLNDDDIAIRCNVATISENEVFAKNTIIDHSSSEISTEDAAVLLDAVRAELENDEFKFYVGTSYRHCLIWKGGKVTEMKPPHDVLGQVIEEYLPKEEILYKMMEKSYEILKDHPINIKRKEAGLNPANCCWFWGAGTKPMVPNFEEKTGKKGYMVSAVDLLKGIAIGAKMGVADVEGANGGLHTNYEGKVAAAIKALTVDNYDFAYVHLEAPDEMGHQGNLNNKIEAIELLDEKVIGPIADALDKEGVDYRLMVLPDHPTPVRLRTHTREAVPYLLYDSTDVKSGGLNYCEKNGKLTDNHIGEGYKLIDYLFQ